MCFFALETLERDKIVWAIRFGCEECVKHMVPTISKTDLVGQNSLSNEHAFDNLFWALCSLKLAFSAIKSPSDEEIDLSYYQQNL